MRLTGRVEEMVTATIEQHALGEPIDHEVLMTVQPGPGGKPTPMIVIILVGRGLGLNDLIGADPIVIPNPRPNEPDVARLVKRGIDAIKAAKSGTAPPAPAPVRSPLLIGR